MEMSTVISEVKIRLSVCRMKVFYLNSDVKFQKFICRKYTCIVSGKWSAKTNTVCK